MSDILHRIQINASPAGVYEAITTSEGLKHWWTADSTAEPKVGSEAVLGFHHGTWMLHMRIDELTPDQRVVWTCLGDDPEWKNTKLAFNLKPAANGQTELHFAHTDWQSIDQTYPSCNTTWGYLMFRLKDYAEGKPTEPYFND